VLPGGGAAALSPHPPPNAKKNKSYGAGVAVGVALLGFLQRSVRRVPLIGDLAGLCEVCVQNARRGGS
jgi:hypothetical protein